MLETYACSDLSLFKDNSFIESIDQVLAKDSSEWRFVMTEKGKKRAKCLCRSVGILVKVEIDIEKPTTNKVTINLYDKDLMPIVEDLYQGDNLNNISKIKEELEGGGNGKGESIFDEYLGTIEKDIDEILLLQLPSSHKRSSFTRKSGDKADIKKEANESMIMMDVFNENAIQ